MGIWSEGKVEMEMEKENVNVNEWQWHNFIVRTEDCVVTKKGLPTRNFSDC